MSSERFLQDNGFGGFGADKNKEVDELHERVGALMPHDKINKHIKYYTEHMSPPDWKGFSHFECTDPQLGYIRVTTHPDYNNKGQSEFHVVLSESFSLRNETATPRSYTLFVNSKGKYFFGTSELQNYNNGSKDREYFGDGIYSDSEATRRLVMALDVVNSTIEKLLNHSKKPKE